MDVLKYKTVVKNMLINMKVPQRNREDMEQECYIALLEKMKEGDPDRHAATICRSTIIDIWRKENYVNSREAPTERPNLRFESLSDPGVERKAMKIGFPEGPEVTDEKMDEAIRSLPYQEYQIIYSLFVEGKTQQSTMKELGLSRRQLENRKKQGIEKLKKYFEVK